MAILAHVLVALDGSAAGNRALALALELSRAYGCELLLCTVADRAGLDASELEDVDEVSNAVLSDAAGRAAAAGARCSTALLEGRPAFAICECAKARAIDAIVMGTQGRRGAEHLLLGSTAEGVLRVANVPVFVVHDPQDIVTYAAELPPVRRFDRILVAVDDSDPADAALHFALDLAAGRQSRVYCCNAIETGDLLDKAVTYGYDPTELLGDMYRVAGGLVATKTALATARGVPAESVVVEGKPTEAILRAAADRGADLIVMGTHGRRGLRRLFLGSVAEHLVRGSDLPVVVVRA